VNAFADLDPKLDVIHSDHNAQDLEKYSNNCAELNRVVSGVVFAETEDDLQSIVQWAARNEVSLYPNSLGRNWGYGSRTPMVDGCVVVSLERMKKIAIDEETGLCQIQPGVSHRDLFDFLSSRNLKFMVPTIGGGPQASILGNTLERGFGLTPISDHFSAVRALRAVLPDGQIYESSLAASGGSESNGSWQWGVGPYIDGLFAQGNLGIVSEITLQLAPRPDQFEAFIFTLEDSTRLPEVHDRLRELLKQSRGLIGGINLSNEVRSLQVTRNWPEGAQQNRALTQQEIKAQLKANSLPEWVGVGALFGDSLFLPSLRKLVKKEIGPLTDKLNFISKDKLQRVQRFARLLPFGNSDLLLKNIRTATRTVELLSGQPSEAELDILQWKTTRSGKDLVDPDQGSTGILWYAPVMPFKSVSIRQMTDVIYRTMPKYEFDPSVMVTLLNSLTVFFTIPILFDRNSDEQVKAAHECFEELFFEGKKLGIVPYRAGLQGTHLLQDEDAPYWQLQKKIKEALDPQGTIAPRRYSVL